MVRISSVSNARMGLILVVAALIGGHGTLGAQFASVLREGLTVGRRSRVELLDGERVTGRVQRVTPDTLTLSVVEYRNAQNAVAATREIPFRSITGIWVASGTHWMEGGGIGAAVGAGFSLAAGILLGGGGGDAPECRGGCLVQMTAGGAAIGAAIGAVIGTFFLRWRVVY